MRRRHHRFRPKRRNVKLPPLSSAIYRRGVGRRTVWGRKTPLYDYSASLAKLAKLLRQRVPTWTKADHREAALQHTKLVRAYQNKWSALIKKVHKRMFKETWVPWHYRISGVGDDRYPTAAKNKLRAWALAEGRHKVLAVIHEHVAKFGRFRKV